MNDLAPIGLDPDFASKKSRYGRVARTILHALTLGQWENVNVVFQVRLSEPERLLLAHSILIAAHPVNVQELAEDIIGGTGSPDRSMHLFHGLMKGARIWARNGSLAERKAYAVACVEAMEEPERQQFREWLDGVGK